MELQLGDLDFGLRDIPGLELGLRVSRFRLWLRAEGSESRASTRAPQGGLGRGLLFRFLFRVVLCTF